MTKIILDLLDKIGKPNYCKNSLCTAGNPADCINFSPVHDLQEVCWFCGLAPTGRSSLNSKTKMKKFSLTWLNYKFFLQKIKLVVTSQYLSKQNRNLWYQKNISRTY